MNNNSGNTLGNNSGKNSFVFDQAEGLRRLVARTTPRVLTLLSADGHLQRTVLLANMAASLASTLSITEDTLDETEEASSARKILVLEAGSTSMRYDSRLGIQRDLQSNMQRNLKRNPHHDLGLIDVAQHHCGMDEILHRSRFGFGFATLNRQVVRAAIGRNDAAINTAFNQLAAQHEIVLVGAELDLSNELPLLALDRGEVMIQVSPGRTSITNAYALIKRLVSRRSVRPPRPFGIIITEASEEQAAIIFNNLAQAAQRYLATALNAYGSLPRDPSFDQAARAGRTVVDAFPATQAAQALRRIADGLKTPTSLSISSTPY